MRNFDEVWVSPHVNVQTGQERFGKAAYKEIHSSLHHRFLNSPLDYGQQHDFPRVPRCRINLTALSQRFNLYFVAGQDGIYVYQPGAGRHILGKPVLFLHPKYTDASSDVGGYIDTLRPRQCNHILVGELGGEEVLILARDDGDVLGYQTQTIADYVYRLGGTREAVKKVDSSLPRSGPIPTFLHENVGMSAWGLAVHDKSRLVAVSCNNREIHVFAFACWRPKLGRPTRPWPEPEDWPEGTRGVEAKIKDASWKAAKDPKTRTRSWRIILSPYRRATNMPSISFGNDDSGLASFVVAIDILGYTWITDIWSMGHNTISMQPHVNRRRQPTYGWAVAVFEDHHFQPAETVAEAFGGEESQVRPVSIRSGTVTRIDISDTVDNLEQDSGVDYRDALRSRVPLQDPVHFPGFGNFTNSGMDTDETQNHGNEMSLDSEDDSGSEIDPYYQDDEEYVLMSDTELHAYILEVLESQAHIIPGELGLGDTDSDATAPEDEGAGDECLQAWRPSLPRDWYQRRRSRKRSYNGGENDTAVPFYPIGYPHTFHTIVPQLGVMYPGLNSKQTEVLCDSRSAEYRRRLANRRLPLSSISVLSPFRDVLAVKSRGRSGSADSNAIAASYSILRTDTTDVDLVSLDASVLPVTCENMLVNVHSAPHPQQVPWDIPHGARLSMLHHIPEIMLVVIGSMGGRVALLSLTRVMGDGEQDQEVVSVSDAQGTRERTLPKRGFRVEHVLPRADEEHEGVRPLCCLLGIAVSPMPEPGAEGLLLRRDEGRPEMTSVLPRRWRLMMYYMDHTVLVYEIAKSDPGIYEVL